MDKKKHRTGLEGYYAVDEKNRKLRYGYTTGSWCGSCGAGGNADAADRRKSGRGGFTDTERNFTASADRGDFHGMREGCAVPCKKTVVMIRM